MDCRIAKAGKIIMGDIKSVILPLKTSFECLIEFYRKAIVRQNVNVDIFGEKAGPLARKFYDTIEVCKEYIGNGESTVELSEKQKDGTVGHHLGLKFAEFCVKMKVSLDEAPVQFEFILGAIGDELIHIEDTTYNVTEYVPQLSLPKVSDVLGDILEDTNSPTYDEFIARRNNKGLKNEDLDAVDPDNVGQEALFQDLAVVLTEENVDEFDESMKTAVSGLMDENNNEKLKLGTGVLKKRDRRQLEGCLEKIRHFKESKSGGSSAKQTTIINTQIQRYKKAAISTLKKKTITQN